MKNNAAHERFFILDVSSNVSALDWELLAKNNVLGAVVKATQGTHHRDHKFVENFMQAEMAGLIVGAYHWCDPTNDSEEQAERFLDVVTDQPISFIALVIEQYWQDWEEWRQLSREGVVLPNKIIPPDEISESSARIASYISQNSDLPLLVYVRLSFLETYAQPILEWLPHYKLWLADLPEEIDEVKTSWAEFNAWYYPTQAGPQLPAGCHNWTLWQFTNNRFYLPGISGARARLSIFNGNRKQFMQFARQESFE